MKVIELSNDDLDLRIKNVGDLEASLTIAEGVTPQIVVDVKDAEDANLNVALPSSVIIASQENNIDLVIKSEDIEYIIPSDALEDEDIPAGAIVEFKSSELIEDETAGLVTGYTDGTFRPDKDISRLEMGVLLSRAVSDIELSAVDAVRVMAGFVDDMEIPAWSKVDVARAVKAGLMNGVGQNKYDPTNSTTRAQAATAIYRLYNR